MQVSLIKSDEPMAYVNYLAFHTYSACLRKKNILRIKSKARTSFIHAEELYNLLFID